MSNSTGLGVVSQRITSSHFKLHVGVDLVVAEHVAAGQEGAVVVERDQRFAQASRRRSAR